MSFLSDIKNLRQSDTAKFNKLINSWRPSSEVSCKVKGVWPKSSILPIATYILLMWTGFGITDAAVQKTDDYLKILPSNDPIYTFTSQEVLTSDIAKHSHSRGLPIILGISRWPFVWGEDVASGGACLTGVYSGWFFRRFLKIPPGKTLPAVLPSTLLPMINSYLFQATYVNNSIIRGRTSPTKLYLVTFCVQLAIGTFLPLVIMGAGSFYIADLGLYYPVPPLRQVPSEVFRLWWKAVRPRLPSLALLAVLQTSYAVHIVHEKRKAFDYMKSVDFRNKKFL